MQPDTKTASEIYIQLGITEPFKAWIARQPGFDTFESFYGKLPGGALGKDYRLKPEQYALLLEPSVPSLPTGQVTKKARLQPLPEVVIEGQVSAYWFCNNKGLPYDKNSLALLGREAGARCNESGILMGVKFQKEIRPDKTKWQGRVRTYPVEILESLISCAVQTPDNTQPTEVKPHA